MALRTLSALAKAIDAVKKEAGDFEEYKSLVDALSGVSKQIGDASGGASADTSSDGEDPFQAAEKKHRAATAARVDAAKAEDKAEQAEPAEAKADDEAGEAK